jgi:hypothetical protein
VIKLKKILLIVALIIVIAFSFKIYALATSEGVWTKKDQEEPSDVINFKVAVNGKRSVDVPMHIDISDGLTEVEAKLIAELTFIQVMGQNVIHQLDTLTFNHTQITANYIWGYDENDMGHVFSMDVDLTTLRITVSHCF